MGYPESGRCGEGIMDLVSTGRLCDEVYMKLREEIVILEIEPGRRLYEQHLAENLGVSRGPVREALRMLEKDRLVEFLPRRGARVSEITGEYVKCLFEVVIELYVILLRR